MKNLTLIIAFIIGTSFILSAQRGDSNNNIRGNSTLNRNPASRGGSSYGRTGNSRPNNYGNNNNGHHSNNNRPHGNVNNGYRGNNNRPYGHVNNVRPNNVNVILTTNRHGHNYNGYCRYTNHNYGWLPVSIVNFNIGCRSIRSYGYDSDRLRSAKHFVRNNYVNAHQIADIMLMFSFEKTKLEFAKYAFNKTCDVHNYGVVFDQLTFNSSRRDLDYYIRDFQW